MKEVLSFRENVTKIAVFNLVSGHARHYYLLIYHRIVAKGLRLIWRNSNRG